jgi:hypothetical protein
MTVIFFLFVFYPVISRFSERLPTSSETVMVPPVIVSGKIYLFNLPVPDSMLQYSTSSSANLYPRDLDGAHTVSPHDFITGVCPAIDTNRPHKLTYHVYTLDPHPCDLGEMTLRCYLLRFVSMLIPRSYQSTFTNFILSSVRSSPT